MIWQIKIFYYTLVEKVCGVRTDSDAWSGIKLFLFYQIIYNRFSNIIIVSILKTKSAEVWMRLQIRYSIEQVKNNERERISEVHKKLKKYWLKDFSLLVDEDIEKELKE